MARSFYLLTMLYSLIAVGCSTDDINNKDKRNTHWAWWVDATTHKGRWIPLGNNPTWKNGTFTKFYFDGKIAAKGKIKDGKYVDTTFCFDRKGDVYVYKLHLIDSVVDFYVVDGPIKVYDIDGKILMEGIIQNHMPRDKWTDYYKTGFTQRIINKVNDTGWVIHYYENGQIKDSLFGMGEYYATIRHWNEDGQLTQSAGSKSIITTEKF